MDVKEITYGKNMKEEEKKVKNLSWRTPTFKGQEEDTSAEGESEGVAERNEEKPGEGFQGKIFLTPKETFEIA